VFVADPQGPWQRATTRTATAYSGRTSPREPTSRESNEDIKAVAHALISRASKVLGWKTPAEAIDEHLRSAERACVASHWLNPINSGQEAPRRAASP
jgi:IS30 family transposase